MVPTRPLFFYAPDEPPTGGDTAATETTDPPAAAGDETQLGDAGKRALDTERSARAAAEKSARDLAAEKKKLEDELAGFRDAQKTETEKLIDQARDEADKAARADVETKYERQLLESRVLVQAAGKVANPKLATKLIDLDALAKSTDGTVDDKTIDAAIADLVKQEPYLATGATSGPGSADGGPRGTRPGQLTRGDLQGMSPEEIVKAKSEGKLDAVLGRT